MLTATEAAGRAHERYPSLESVLVVHNASVSQVTRDGTNSGSMGGDVSSGDRTSMDGAASGDSHGRGGYPSGAHSGAVTSNPNPGGLGTVVEGTPMATPTGMGFARPPLGPGGTGTGTNTNTAGLVPMSTGGESGIFGDARTPAPDSSRGLMPPPPPSTATAAGVPATDLVTPSPASDVDHAAGKPPAVLGGLHGGGRGDGGRRKFVDEGKLRKVSGQLFQESAGTGAGAGSGAGVRRSSRLAAQSGGGVGGGGLDFSTPAMEGATTSHEAHADGADPASASPPQHHRARRPGQRGSLDGGSRPPAFPPHVPMSGGLNVTAGGRDGRYNAGRFAEGAAATAALLKPIADGLRVYSMFRCDDALGHLRTLPRSQYVTGYVLCLVGRAYAEMVNYPEARRAFEWSRSVCPHRLDGMEVYSTVLWHLKKEIELSYLAQECVSLDRLAPQTWCVLGNCFSLQKEHETALRFFQRALQLDPRCTYAHTLCGHEFFANEDFEKAMGCYRNALRLDSRHYNAWYGLGTVYYRQEKYELSEYHFRHALSINSRSSVLFCYLGMAQHAVSLF